MLIISLILLTIISLIGLIISQLMGVSIGVYIALILQLVSITLLVKLKRNDRQERFDLNRLLATVTELNHNRTAPAVILDDNRRYYQLAVQIDQLREKQIAHQNLIRNEERENKKLLSRLPLGIMQIDSDNQVLFYNQAMTQILKMAVKAGPHSYLADIHDYQILTIIDEALKSGHSQHKEISNFQGDNQTLDVQAIMVRFDEGYHLILVIYDISQIVNAKQMQIDFLRNASHELKTPITSISGFTKTLLDGAMNDPEVAEDFLKTIDENADALINLLQDILTISYTSMNRQLEIQTIDLKQFVAQELRSFGSQIEQKQLTVTVDGLDQTQLIQFDRQSLKQIIGNLISNAIKYNVNNGELNLTYTDFNDHWKLSIADSGVGIDKNSLERIFERFYRVDTSHSNQQVSGTGLGLAIVKEVVDNLNGQITVNSQLGVGTKIEVQFKK